LIITQYQGLSVERYLGQFLSLQSLEYLVIKLSTWYWSCSCFNCRRFSN